MDNGENNHEEPQGEKKGPAKSQIPMAICLYPECVTVFAPYAGHQLCYIHAPCVTKSGRYNPKKCAVCCPILEIIEDPEGTAKWAHAQSLLAWSKQLRCRMVKNKIPGRLFVFSPVKKTLMKFSGPEVTERVSSLFVSNKDGRVRKASLEEQRAAKLSQKQRAVKAAAILGSNQGESSATQRDGDTDTHGGRGGHSSSSSCQIESSPIPSSSLQVYLLKDAKGAKVNKRKRRKESKDTKTKAKRSRILSSSSSDTDAGAQSPVYSPSSHYSPVKGNRETRGGTPMGDAPQYYTPPRRLTNYNDLVPEVLITPPHSVPRVGDKDSQGMGEVYGGNDDQARLRDALHSYLGNRDGISVLPPESARGILENMPGFSFDSGCWSQKPLDAEPIHEGDKRVWVGVRFSNGTEIRRPDFYFHQETGHGFYYLARDYVDASKGHVPVTFESTSAKYRKAFTLISRGVAETGCGHQDSNAGVGPQITVNQWLRFNRENPWLSGAEFSATDTWVDFTSSKKLPNISDVPFVRTFLVAQGKDYHAVLSAPVATHAKLQKASFKFSA